ncbi:MAG: hypothetical protein PHI74_06430 [Methanocellales archaeon]|nr:hypothetical protein [Methanocellales archaeon]MDD5485643.1 hypothetical protein [Methanocellales archaeon]
MDLTLGSPSLINILIFEHESREDTNRAFESIKRNYEPKSMEGDKNSIKIILGHVLCGVELIKEKNYNVFSIDINHLHDNYVSKEWQKDLEYYQSQVQPVLDFLPKNPILSLSVFVGPVDSQDEALNLVRQYSEYVNCHKVAAGIVGDYLLATFRKPNSETELQFLRRELLLSPINLSPSKVKHTISDLIVDIKNLAINLVEVDRVHRLCQPYFPQIDSGEDEIQEKIDSILNRMRETKPVEIETLKSWLSDVMERYSSLSVLSSSIKRDQIIAKTYIEENKNLLNQWSETSVKGYTTNTLTETIGYTHILKSFEDFTDRAEALRTQLGTVSNMIRTYLGILQQEQSSEILKQQVNLLHAIEESERLLNVLTWVLAIVTITLVIIEVARILHILQ